jgi:hypothetical protein
MACIIHLTLHWFFLLLSMVYIVSLPSLVHNYWAWFVLFHFPHWFIITGLCWCSLKSHLTGSSLLCMVCIVLRYALLIPPYWSMFVLIHFSHWFIITGHGLFCFN